VRDARTGVIRILDAHTIVCAERSGRRVDIRTTEGLYSTYYTIAKLADRLSPHGFVLASRSRVINVARISHLVPNGDGSYDAVMDDRARTTVTVSRHHAQWLIQTLQP
jgi:DNA-binding LytR/AlgR family response regulator